MSDVQSYPGTVRRNSAANRYEIELGGHLAVAEYETGPDGRVTFTHTFVPPELRGKGLAEKLVRRALEDARTEGRRIVAACSYVAVFIERNPEFKPLLA